MDNDTEKQEINLLLFIVEAFGYNRKIYRDIDKLYNKHKYLFYKEAKGSKFYSHPMIIEGDVLQEEYCRKSLGILLCINKDDIQEQIFDIIKKGWNYAYTYVSNNSKIDVLKFLGRFIKKHNGINNLTDDDINTNSTMLIFIASLKNKEIIENDTYRQIYNILMLRLKQYEKNSPYRVNYNNINKENKQKIIELKDVIFNKYGEFNSYITIEKNKKLKEFMPNINFIFDYENLSASSIMGNIALTNQEIEELLYIYIILHKNTDVDKAANFLAAAIYMRSILKVYNTAKEYYFKNNKGTLYIELEQLEKESQKCKASLKIKDEIISNLSEQIKQKDKEIARLKSELNTTKKNNNELNSLREYLFDLDNKIEYKSEQYNYSKLNDIRGLILGGHPNWQHKMKKLLPSFVFISPNNKNFDIEVLKNINFVFIYTNYLSHAIYYKLMSEIQKNDISVKYLQPNTNMDITLSQIYKYIFIQ